VSGPVDERISTSDGSFVGRRPPSVLAATHALLHGRVVLYRPGLPAAEVTALDAWFGAGRTTSSSLPTRPA
jgi:hypothetical protein